MRLKEPNEYPWRTGNCFSLLCDGESFFPEMLSAIASAQSHIYIEQYLVESGVVLNRFITALAESVQRGVSVMLLMDGFGSLLMTDHDQERLIKAGITVVRFNPMRYHKWRNNLYRDHRKMLLVDGRVAFVGGAGIADQFDGTVNPSSWRDNVVKIEGEVVQDWQQAFIGEWQKWSSVVTAIPVMAVDPVLRGQSGRVVLGSPGGRRKIELAYAQQVAASQSRVWLATAYFIPSRRIRRQLQRAAERGVDVRLLLPGEVTDHPAVRQAGRRYYEKLLRSGVKIYEYQRRFVHSKVLLVDGWVSIGSSNVDRWNLRWNLEANQEIDAPLFAVQVDLMFCRDFESSRQCVLDDWLNRSLFERLREWFWGRVALLLERYSYQKQLQKNKK